MDKKCFKCGRVLPIDSFYKHSKMKDGHLNKCIECARKDAIGVRNNNIEYYREYDHERNKTQLRKEHNKNHEIEWRARNREKYVAHNVLYAAVRDGKIKKPIACEICGKETELGGHHYDYSTPLSVIWVCAKCHCDIHKKQKAQN